MAGSRGERSTKFSGFVTYDLSKRAKIVAFVTIDGKDAKDFDDAVFVSGARGWRLRVAIADVAEYVMPKLWMLRPSSGAISLFSQ